MTSTQIRNKLVDARIARNVRGNNFYAIAAAMPRAELDALSVGVVVSKLTPSQSEYFRTLRLYNTQLDRVRALEAELEMVIACEEFELEFSY